MPRTATQPPPPVMQSAAAGPAFATVLAALTEHLDQAAASCLQTATDPAPVHAYRVSLRKIRSLYRAAGRLRPDATRQSLRAEFRWLSARTSAVRDLDVLIAALPHYAANIDDPLGSVLSGEIAPHLQSLAAQSRADLAATLHSDRYANFQDEWRSTVRAIGAADTTSGSLVARIERVTTRLHAQLVHYHATREDTTTLHALRKTCKRLRYLLEIFRGLYRPDAITPTIARLKHLQEQLGAYWDLEVHGHSLPRHLCAPPFRSTPSRVARVADFFTAERTKRFTLAMSALSDYRQTLTLPTPRACGVQLAAG